MSERGPRKPRSVRSEGRRPTPVRQGVESTPTAAEPSPVVRRYRGPDGGEWEVEVAGRSVTGRRGEPGAGLLLLVFRPGPGSEGDNDGAREALVPGERLEDVPETELEEARRRARPHRSDPDPDPGFFDGTRSGRSRG